jgi:hypothetical protein
MLEPEALIGFRLGLELLFIYKHVWAVSMEKCFRVTLLFTLAQWLPTSGIASLFWMIGNKEKLIICNRHSMIILRRRCKWKEWNYGLLFNLYSYTRTYSKILFWYTLFHKKYVMNYDVFLEDISEQVGSVYIASETCISELPDSNLSHDTSLTRQSWGSTIN